MKTALKGIGIGIGIYGCINILTLAWVGLCAVYSYAEDACNYTPPKTYKESLSITWKSWCELNDDCWGVTGNMVNSVKNIFHKK